MPTNTRPLLTTDIDRCAWHPERESIGWHDVRGEDGAVEATVGVCAACSVDLGSIDGPVGGAVRLLSPGAPCMCGPGFCASKRGLGFLGYCAGSRANAGPDCARCGAPHQSDEGCWLCLPGAREDWERENDQAWVELARAGCRGGDAFAVQDANTGLSFLEAARVVIAARKGVA